MHTQSFQVLLTHTKVMEQDRNYTEVVTGTELVGKKTWKEPKL